MSIKADSEEVRRRVAEKLGPRPDKESELEGGRMPLVEHLADLRKRMVYCLLIVSGLAIVAWNFNDTIIKFLEQPLLQALPAHSRHMYFTGIGDKFFVYMKVAIAVAVAAATPFILYQVWRFIAPGLYKSEQKAIAPFILLGSFAFYAGLVFCYYVVLPTGYTFLVQFGGDEQAMITLTEYFGLTIKLLLALGFTFEVPVLLLILVRLELITVAMLKKYRRHAFLVNAILAAVLTPTPDAATMLLVLFPLQILYELALFGARWFEPKAA